MLISNTKIAKLDYSSKILWEAKGLFHHDIDILKDGKVVAIANRQEVLYPEIEANYEIIDNLFVTLTHEWRCHE